jgi:NADH dehydrogenase FAD-containing subunit
VSHIDPEKRSVVLCVDEGVAGNDAASGARRELTYDHLIIVVHSRERILPELSASLAAYALERMMARGVTFKLNARLADAQPGVVILNPAEEMRAQTLVWTAGTAPNPLLRELPVEHDRRGAVVVDWGIELFFPRDIVQTIDLS